MLTAALRRPVLVNNSKGIRHLYFSAGMDMEWEAKILQLAINVFIKQQLIADVISN